VLLRLLLLAACLGGCDDDEKVIDGGADLAVAMDLSLDMALMACDITANDCPSGYKCTTIATPLPLPAGVCRKTCTSTSNCASGEKCGGGAPGSSSGTCLPTCTVFGNDCAAGYDCSGFTFPVGETTAGLPFCRPFGSKALYESCAGGSECGPRLFCAFQKFCSAMCDDAHPCPAPNADSGITSDGGAGFTCVPHAPGMLNNAGSCL
jgi:hypothetical protein